MDWNKIITKLEYNKSEDILSYLLDILDIGFKKQVYKIVIDHDFKKPTSRISYLNKNLYKGYKVVLRSESSNFDSLDIMVSVIEGLERLRDDYRARLQTLNLNTEGGIGDKKSLTIEFMVYDEKDTIDWTDIFLP